MKFKFILFIAFLIKISFSYAQLDLLADLNKNTYGSSPNNFIENNGVTYFLSSAGLVKTVGVENKITIIDSVDVIGQHSYQFFTRPIKRLLYKHQNKIYYFKSAKDGVQLWSSDGSSTQLVGSKLSIQLGYTELYFINDKVCFFTNENLYSIGNTETKLLGSFPTYNYRYSNYRPISHANTLYFFSYVTSKQRLLLWKSNGIETGTVKLDSLNIAFNQAFSDQYSEQNSKSDTLKGKPFLLVSKALNSSSFENSMYDIASTGFNNKRIINTSTLSFGNITHMRSMGGKVIFSVNGQELWITNGSAAGTINLKKSTILNSQENFNFGYLNGSFYFSATENNQEGLWKTDGTLQGTIKVMNTKASYFQETNTEVLFKTDPDELWKTDGTVANTKKIEAYAIPLFQKGTSSGPFFEVFKTSGGNYLWKNYSPIFGTELCTSNINSSNATFFNLNRRTKASVISSKKFKVKDIWYYNGLDANGSEIWRTNGTAAGTYMLKDINPGLKGIELIDMAEFAGKLYFTIFKDDFHEFWVSDGTTNGTQVLKSVKGLGRYSHEIKVGKSKIFFGLTGTNGKTSPWVSDGTPVGTKEIPSSRPISDNCSPFTVRGDSIIFTDYVNLWSGNANGVTPIYGDLDSKPQFFREYASYNSKLYTTAKFYNITTRVGNDVLVESNGTKNGTKIIKYFKEGELTNFRINIFNIINDKLIFPTSNIDSVNIWSHNMTSNITSKIYNLGSPYKVGNSFKTTVLNKKLVILTKPLIRNSLKFLWITDGTKQNFSSVPIVNYTKTELLDFVKTDSTLIYSTLDSNSHYQLWETNLLKAPRKLVQGNVFQPIGLDQFEEDYPYSLFFSGFIGGANLFPLIDNILLFPNKIMVWNFKPNIGYEPYLFTKKQVLGLEKRENKNLYDCENLVVYPNPSLNGAFYLNNDYKINSLKVYDMAGREIFAKLSKPEGQSILEVNALIKGNYVIKISTPTCVTAKRISLK